MVRDRRRSFANHVLILQGDELALTSRKFSLLELFRFKHQGNEDDTD